MCAYSSNHGSSYSSNDEQIMEKNVIIVQIFRHTHFMHLKSLETDCPSEESPITDLLMPLKNTSYNPLVRDLLSKIKRQMCIY